jgi:uncharacterized protein (TIGR00290 family)
VYEREMARVLGEIQQLGVSAVVFGDLFLEDIRQYREARLAEVGMRGIFPLWGRKTDQLAREMIAVGIRATLTCIDPKKLDRTFAGRSFDAALLDALPEGVDPCGENGEFHTCVVAGPIFSRSIPVAAGERVERDGYGYCDLVMTS